MNKKLNVQAAYIVTVDQAVTFDAEIAVATAKNVFSILTERQKMVVYMFYFEQKKQADIAEILGIQRVTVATILRTALKTLRDRYPSF